MKELSEYEVREVKGYEGKYSITDCGKVYSHIGAGRWLKPILNAQGYLSVNLYKDGEKKPTTIHRLVALHFVEGHFEGAVVNHLDEVKTNNNYINLEWVTSGDNSRYSLCRTVTLLSPQGKEFTFTNIRGFARQHGLNTGNLNQVVNGKKKSCKGWTLPKSA